MLLSALILFASCLLVHAAPVDDFHGHEHPVAKRLPSTWYHPRDHPVHTLFSRAPGDDESFPPVGSSEWSRGWPQRQPDTTQLPREWVDALNAAVAAGKIPNVPQSHNTPQTNPVYPQGVNPNGPEVCSATYKCRSPDDIWDGPDGTFATSFDDGPMPPTAKLLDFLDGHNEVATHFMIGVNILSYPQLFQRAFDSGNDIAVHTWSHPYMTTLNNLEVLAQFGYTMELIRRSAGGRVPRFWRPPYGDSDNRVRAIAKEVFGLRTVIWNQDTSDWGMLSNSTTPAQVNASLTRFLTGPKSPGLIILEHESGDSTVQAFVDAYPLIKSNGWRMSSLASLMDNDAGVYQNAQNSTASVQPDGILVGPTSTGGTSSGSASSQTSAPSATTSGSPTGTETAVGQMSSSSAIPNSGSPFGRHNSWTAGTLLTLLTLTVWV